VGYDTVTDNNGLFFIYLAIIGAQICEGHQPLCQLKAQMKLSN